MKICKKCNIPKELNQYNKNKSKKDNLDIYCKECVIKKGKRYRNVKIPLISKDPLNNKICRKCKDDLPKSNFSKKQNEDDGLYYYCKECVKKDIKNKDWYKNQYNDYKKKWTKNEYKENINFKLKSNYRCRLNSILKQKRTKKSNTSLKYLGCNLNEYKSYLEKLFKNEMTWSNHGKVWEIDHIEPLSKFDLSIEENIYKAFNYKNTKPKFKTTKIAESFGYKDQIGNRNKGNKDEI